MTNDQAFQLSENDTVYMFFNNIIKTCIVYKITPLRNRNVEVSTTDNGKSGRIYKLKPQQVFHSKKECYDFHLNENLKHRKNLEFEILLRVTTLEGVNGALNALAEMKEICD